MVPTAQVILFSTSICCILLFRFTKTLTLLLKSEILNFETLSHVMVYRTENVSYRQGPYRIRIVAAAQRIAPAQEFSSHQLVLILFGGQVILSEDATIVFKEVKLLHSIMSS